MTTLLFPNKHTMLAANSNHRGLSLIRLLVEETATNREQTADTHQNGKQDGAAEDDDTDNDEDGSLDQRSAKHGELLFNALSALPAHRNALAEVKEHVDNGNNEDDKRPPEAEVKEQRLQKQEDTAQHTQVLCPYSQTEGFQLDINGLPYGYVLHHITEEALRGTASNLFHRVKKE